ncbi:MAG: aminotransferase class IV [Methylobacterium sp.]|uniref:aminotransferase class IV n=1 Tax=Methylobacterium sp. TaxID=409 RepID=UPI0025CD9C7F|nr:aminotransferase class IV [Methylobacterium sp.]MBX9932129.1 aminotransferase class IV [Methylobacterium sp.]
MLWLDGRLQERTSAPFDLGDRGLLLGDGLFDTAMALRGRVAFEEEHVARLAAGAESLGFEIDRDRVVSAMRALAGAMPRAAIRTTVTRGSGPRGLKPPEHPVPFHWASAAPLGEGMAFSPVTMMVTPIRRNETSPAARVKTLGYLDAVLATREARAQGFDEALFLNTRDRVACAATGNLFLVEEDGLSTPAIDEGALPGIVRNLIVSRLAPALGLRISETALTKETLEDARGVFMTNSLRLLASVPRLNNRNIPFNDDAVLVRLVAALREAVAESCRVCVTEVA